MLRRMLRPLRAGRKNLQNPRCLGSNGGCPHRTQKTIRGRRVGQLGIAVCLARNFGILKLEFENLLLGTAR